MSNGKKQWSQVSMETSCKDSYVSLCSAFAHCQEIEIEIS